MIVAMRSPPAGPICGGGIGALPWMTSTAFASQSVTTLACAIAAGRSTATHAVNRFFIVPSLMDAWAMAGPADGQDCRGHALRSSRDDPGVGACVDRGWLMEGSGLDRRSPPDA